MNISFRVEPTFWLGALWIGWANVDFNLPLLAIWVSVVFVSILVHELGHAIAAGLCGSSAHITLQAFGGLTEHKAFSSTGRRLFITLAGPAAGAFLAITAFSALSSLASLTPPLLRYALSVTYHVNVFWTALNLLPVLPLDGGQVVRLLLERAFGLRGLKVALIIGIAVSGLVALYGLFANAWVMLAFFAHFLVDQIRSLHSMWHVRAEDFSERRKKQLEVGARLLDLGDAPRARLHFEELLAEIRPRGPFFGEVSLFLSESYRREGQVERAFEVLKAARESLDFAGLERLMHYAYEESAFAYALELAKDLFRDSPSAELAYFAARIAANLGNVKEVEHWLACARSLGYEAIDLSLEDFSRVKEQLQHNSTLV